VRALRIFGRGRENLSEWFGASRDHFALDIQWRPAELIQDGGKPVLGEVQPFGLAKVELRRSTPMA
jgi:hypothetical protein